MEKESAFKSLSLLQVSIACPFSSQERPMKCYLKIPFTFQLQAYLSSSLAPIPIEKISFDRLKIRCNITTIDSHYKTLLFPVELFDSDNKASSNQLACSCKISVLFPQSVCCTLYCFSFDFVYAVDSENVVQIGFPSQHYSEFGSITSTLFVSVDSISI